MPLTWLIEADVYGDETQPLIDEIRRQGRIAEVISYRAVRKGTTLNIAGAPLLEGACVLGYGTFPFAQEILLHQPWRPGAWCSATNLDCAAYYPFFRTHLLNQEHEILTGTEAIRQIDRLFGRFGREERVFARPTSCHKLFVGRCIDRSSFAAALAPTRYDPTTCVVVAAPQPIESEWRVVVVGDRVVAGSRYARHGERSIAAECPIDVRAFAETILAETSWRPDAAFMMDVCESAGQLRLVELNSFSGSWLYRCDLESIVSAVNQAAEEVASIE